MFASHHLTQVHNSGVVQERGRPRLLSKEDESELMDRIEQVGGGRPMSRKSVEAVVRIPIAYESAQSLFRLAI